MEHSMEQPELSLIIVPDPQTVPINARCVLKKDGDLRVVYVAGLPMHHWTTADRLTEAYAMVSLVHSGYADQNDVARVFGYSARTLRRYQQRFESGGMAQLGRSGGRPQETTPGLWMKTARMLKDGGLSIRDTAQRLGFSKTTVGRWLIGPDSTTKADRVEPSLESQGNKEQPQGGGVYPRQDKGDRATWNMDPEYRLFDRLLARLGKIEDADPIFTPGKRIPRAGALLAVPALVHSGIFAVAQEVYGHIGPAFYGLRTTMLAMLLLALLRIKRPEGLKEYAPPDLGRLLGLDRAPEVKTLRRKLTRLAAYGKAEVFGRKLAKLRVTRRGKALGFLYMDGHVRVYHGRRRIAKAHATRMRLSLPATTDYWVNDQRGDPLFVVTAEFNAGLVKMLPVLLAQVRKLIAKKRRITVVFDRGGWSPKLFVRLIKAGFDILTYRKGRWRKIPRNHFVSCAKTIERRRVVYDLNDRNIRLLKGRLRLRQVTRLGEGGHQTPIVTSRRDIEAIVVAYRMFERWRQENFFKYLREEYALDSLVDYRVESEDASRIVPNPERRFVDKKLAVLRAELRQSQALYGEAAAANEERRRSTMRGFKIAHGRLGQRIRASEERIAALKQRRKNIPARVAIAELDGEPLVRLSRERKHLTNCVRMVAYQAESDLLALLRPHYARADEEGRTLVTSALENAADLEVQDSELRVTLAPMSSSHRSRAVAALCEKLTSMEVKFPGTNLRMHFGVSA